MSPFDESVHPRGQLGNSGQFRVRENTPPDAELMAREDRLSELEDAAREWDVRREEAQSVATGYLSSNMPAGVDRIFLERDEGSGECSIASFLVAASEVTVDELFSRSDLRGQTVLRELRESFDHIDEAVSLFDSALLSPDTRNGRLSVSTSVRSGRSVDFDDVQRARDLLFEARCKREATAVHAIRETIPPGVSRVVLGPTGVGLGLKWCLDDDGERADPFEFDPYAAQDINDIAAHIGVDPPARGAGAAGLLADIDHSSSNPRYLIARAA